MEGTKEKSDLPASGRQTEGRRREWKSVVGPTRTHTEKPSRLQSYQLNSPDLPVPGATASAWKSCDLPLMLNHFLTRLLDHDSCGTNRNAAGTTEEEEEQQQQGEDGQVR